MLQNHFTAVLVIRFSVKLADHTFPDVIEFDTSMGGIACEREGLSFTGTISGL